MPVQPDFTPTTQISSFTSLDPTTQSNNSTSNTISWANQPWTLRLGQHTNDEFFASNGNKQFGFDLVMQSTYKSISNPAYALSYASYFDGTSTWDYAAITLPQFGIYEFDFVCMLQSNLATPDLQMIASIEINSVVTYQSSIVHNGDVENKLNSAILPTGPDQHNKGDVVTCFLQQNNGAGATLNTSAGFSANLETANYLTIRYMGLN